MLTDFPKSFGFDPTVMGEPRAGYIAGGRRMARPLRPVARNAALPVVLVADELLPVDPQEESDTAPHDASMQNPFFATAVVGMLLATAGYFVGFN